MPRPADVPALTAQQARYILEKLIDERKVSAADIRRHLAGMWQEMTFIERRLSELRGVASSAHPVARVRSTVDRVRTRVRRRRAVSPEVAASQKLQGQYLGYMRQIPDRERKTFREMAQSKGRQAAVDAMKKRLGK